MKNLVFPNSVKFFKYEIYPTKMQIFCVFLAGFAPLGNLTKWFDLRWKVFRQEQKQKQNMFLWR